MLNSLCITEHLVLSCRYRSKLFERKLLAINIVLFQYISHRLSNYSYNRYYCEFNAKQINFFSPLEDKIHIIAPHPLFTVLLSIS